MNRLLILLLLLLSTTGFAQQKSLISQYMYDGLLLNPAYAGNQNRLTVNLLYRKQWINFEGAPTTAVFSAHSSIKNKRIGVGLAVIKDNIGVHGDIGTYGMYAYKIPLRRGVLSMGLQGGFNKLTSEFNQLNLPQSNDRVFTTFVNRFNPNFGAGLFYSTKTAYAGFSVPYILENRINNNSSEFSSAREARYYFLTAGKVLEVNKNLKVRPSTLIRYQQGSPVGFDVNMNFFLQDVINLGVSYRSSDAFTGMFGIILNNNFVFNYAYDYTLSSLRNYSRGTHEFILTYHINLFQEKCHAYF